MRSMQAPRYKQAFHAEELAVLKQNGF